MLKATRWWWPGLMMIGTLAFALAGAAPAQEKKKPLEKHDPAALDNSLRDVINAGAKMFNEQGDHAGCYRLYQGSLLSMRPFLAPDLQKSIDQGLTSAEKMHSFADRAFELRRVLDEIRAKGKPVGSTGEKNEKGDKGQVAGKLLYEGQAVASGYFVTLVSSDNKKFSSAIQKDGSFQFKTPIPTGDYRIAIEPIPGDAVKSSPLPTRYGSADSSSLVIRVRSGKQMVGLELVK